MSKVGDISLLVVKGDSLLCVDESNYVYKYSLAGDLRSAPPQVMHFNDKITALTTDDDFNATSVLIGTESGKISQYFLQKKYNWFNKNTTTLCTG